MNNFEAKYIKISSVYLDEKLYLAKKHYKKITTNKETSTIQKIVSSIFKS